VTVPVVLEVPAGVFTVFAAEFPPAPSNPAVPRAPAVPNELTSLELAVPLTVKVPTPDVPACWNAYG
jgi:hypothetical protein